MPKKKSATPKSKKHKRGSAGVGINPGAYGKPKPREKRKAS